MAEHGTRSRYNAGCHCHECKRAERDYCRQRAAQRIPKDRGGNPNPTPPGMWWTDPNIDDDGWTRPEWTRPDWHDHAACVGADPDWFFPDLRTNDGPATVQLGKAICAACPVALECADQAVVMREKHGTWAGVDEKARRQRRQARAQVHQRKATA